MIIYTAGQYGPSTKNVPEVLLDEFLHSPEAQAGKDRNIAHARKIAIRLWEEGHAVICPHLNTIHMERDCTATHKDYLRGDCAIIERCDAILMLEGWKESRGAQQEHDHALKHGIQIFYEGQSWPTPAR